MPQRKKLLNNRKWSGKCIHHTFVVSFSSFSEKEIQTGDYHRHWIVGTQSQQLRKVTNFCVEFWNSSRGLAQRSEQLKNLYVFFANFCLIVTRSSSTFCLAWKRLFCKLQKAPSVQVCPPKVWNDAKKKIWDNFCKMANESWIPSDEFQ